MLACDVNYQKALELEVSNREDWVFDYKIEGSYKKVQHKNPLLVFIFCFQIQLLPLRI